MLGANNLSDVHDTTLSRQNLGLGNSATLDVGTTANTVAAGNDPRIVGAAPLASPVFTGNPQAPTPTAGDNDTSIATTAFVNAAVAAGGAAGAVRYDATQTLTTPQLIQARQNIYAAPFDAMAYSGIQINGAMEVNQERGAGVTNVNGAYLGDGWKLYYSGTMAVTGACLPAALVSGFPCLTYMNSATAQASLGASDYAQLSQLIEGWRIARLAWGTINAQPITIGFWSAHHRTGIYSVAVRNGASNRSYVVAYTHNVADIPQYNTITIPGDTSGTWAIDNTLGLCITFVMAMGSGFIAPSVNTWLAGNYLAAPGQVNGVAATSDIIRITGVTVLPGNEAPSAPRSPFITRPFPQELDLCKRYYEKTYPYADKPGNAYGGAGGGCSLVAEVYATATFPALSWYFKVAKRAAPSVAIYSPWTGAAGVIRSDAGDIGAAILGASGTGENHVFIVGTGTSTPGPTFVYCHATADARL